MRRYSLLVAVISLMFTSAALALATPAPVSGKNPANIEQIIPADVLARVDLVAQELDLIRVAMGKPKQQRTIINITHASPREVYFVGQALFSKANWLAHEVTGSYELLTQKSHEEVTPAHVWQLVDRALERILLVKQKLNITEQVKERLPRSNTTPSHVFNKILEVNQTLNTLLYRQVMPGDVFEQVTLAVNDAANLLRHLNKAPYIPEAKRLKNNIAPSEVYAYLVKIIQKLERVAIKSKVNMLGVEIRDIGRYQISPGLVYDLTKIIVAEMDYFNTKIEITERMPSYYPGYKTPAQVLQRATILAQQVDMLLDAVNQNPDWLNN